MEGPAKYLTYSFVIDDRFFLIVMLQISSAIPII